MSELISGEIALSKVHTGQVQYKCDNDPSIQDRWTTITDHFWDQYHLGLFLNKDTSFKFRLKPRTITINGIEVPAPFKPKDDCMVYIIDDGKTQNYRAYNYCLEEDDGFCWIGVWRTEEEIKQVVAALRTVFGGKS